MHNFSDEAVRNVYRLRDEKIKDEEEKMRQYFYMTNKMADEEDMRRKNKERENKKMMKEFYLCTHVVYSQSNRVKAPTATTFGELFIVIAVRDCEVFNIGLGPTAIPTICIRFGFPGVDFHPAT